MVVAIVALVVAASGTAVAAGSLVSGDKLIKKNSLSGNRLRNRSVTGSKIKLSSLGTVPNAAHASTADTATNATNATNASSASISKVTYVSATVAVDNSSSSVPAVATATCPAGTVVLGGGASIVDNQFGYVVDAYPAGKTAWTAHFFGNNPTTGTVYGICGPAAATAP
jgi:hypothetical protein